MELAGKALGMPCFALPYRAHGPTESAEHSGLFPIPPLVGFELGKPVFEFRFRRLAVTAPMSMPETAMNENRLPPSRENEIWLARQSGVVKTIAIAHAMQEPPDEPFWPRVLTVNGAHGLTSLSFGAIVSHVSCIFNEVQGPIRSVQRILAATATGFRDIA